MTFARRIDSNTKAITEAFRRCGCLVHCTNQDWDLTVMRMGQICLVEVKDGKKSPSRTKLTKRSQGLVDAGWPIHRVESLDDVMTVCDKLRQLAMERDNVTEGGR